MNITVAGYEPIAAQACVETTIRIEGTPPVFPDKTDWRKHVEEFYKTEAQKIYTALSQSLPQGTLHQLLILMLQGHEKLLKTGIENE